MSLPGRKVPHEEYVKTLFPEASVKAMICGIEKDFAKVSDEIKVRWNWLESF